MVRPLAASRATVAPAQVENRATTVAGPTASAPAPRRRACRSTISSPSRPPIQTAPVNRCTTSAAIMAQPGSNSIEWPVRTGAARAAAAATSDAGAAQGRRPRAVSQ